MVADPSVVVTVTRSAPRTWVGWRAGCRPWASTPPRIEVQPQRSAAAVDDGLRPGHYSSLVGWVLVLLVVGVLNAAVAIARHRTLTKVRMDAAFRTVDAVVEHSTRLGSTLSRKVTAGEMTTIGIGDVWVISQSLTLTGPGAGTVVAHVVVAGMLLSISPLLALVVLLGAPVVAAAVGPLLSRLRSARTTGSGRVT